MSTVKKLLKRIAIIFGVARTTSLGRDRLSILILFQIAVGLLASPAYSENPSAPSEPFQAELTFYLDEEPSPLEGVKYNITSQDNSYGGREFLLTVELSLPKECEQLDALMDRWGGWQDGAGLSKSFAYAAFCSRMELLSGGARAAKFDFVSEIDFTQMPLALIPYEIDCRGVSSNEFFEYCDNPEVRLGSLCGEGKPVPPLNYVTFSLGWSGQCAPNQSVEQHCQLVDGYFRGKFVVANGKIDCIRDEQEEEDGIKVYDVQFRDMNNDGFMDAIVSVAQVGSFSAPSGRLSFILTKTEAGGSLTRIPMPAGD